MCCDKYHGTTGRHRQNCPALSCQVQGVSEGSCSMGITQTPSLEVEGPMAITAFADPTSSHPKGRGTRQTTFSTALAYALMSSRRALFFAFYFCLLFLILCFFPPFFWRLVTACKLQSSRVSGFNMYQSGPGPRGAPVKPKIGAPVPCSTVSQLKYYVHGRAPARYCTCIHV